MNNPLVTVNILSFNRKDELRYTLTKVFEQDYKNIEVIVVDNASSDGTQQMIKTEFPNVNVIELPDNIGIAGWNKGFEVAKGEYVLVLDDDSYPDTNCIEFALREMLKNNDMGTIACNVYNGVRRKYEISESAELFNHFVGCGALIRKHVFQEVGEFDENIFVYVHENDFAIRLINKDYKIGFVEEALIYHKMYEICSIESPINNKYYFKYSTQNNFYLNSKYLSFMDLIIVNTKYFINRLLIAIYFGYLKILIQVILKYFGKIFRKEIEKVKLSQKTLKIFNYRKMPLFDREYFGKLNNGKGKLNYPFRYIVTLFKSSKIKKEFVD